MQYAIYQNILKDFIYPYYTRKCLASKESTQPKANINIKGQEVPDDEDIDINKIAQGNRPKGGRNMANITAKQYKDKEAKRLVPEKAKRIQGKNDSKNTEAKRHMIEKAKIEALTEKHRLHTPKTPDKVNKLGTGKNAIEKGQEGTSKGKPPYKKATKDIQVKKSHKKRTEATNAKIGKTDTLLGDPVAITSTCITNGKEKGQKDKTNIDDIGIFEFIFKGLPEPPELEGIDEDRLRDLQNVVQEQLCKRDEESVVLLHCGCLSLNPFNPFIEFRIWNNSSSPDVLNVQASKSISPKYVSKSKTTSHCHLLLHDCTNAAV